MNYFSPNTAAERYAKGRPNFHHHTIRCVLAVGTALILIGMIVLIWQ
jgi:hypothetical protein